MMAISGLLPPVFSAGFYYKTFMWPAKAWERLYEPLIRRAAGLGRASGEPDPDTYEHAHLFCDVLVIGGGPAGLAATLAAARTGARVVLCEEDGWLGGRLLSDHDDIDGKPAAAWLADAQEQMSEFPELRVLRRTTVTDGLRPRRLPGLATHRRPHGAAGGRTAPARVAHRCTRRGARRGGAGTADGLSRQRSAGRDAGIGGAHLHQSFRRAPGAPDGAADHQRRRHAHCGRRGTGRHRHRRRGRSARSRRHGRSMRRCSPAGRWSGPKADQACNASPCWTPPDIVIASMRICSRSPAAGIRRCI